MSAKKVSKKQKKKGKNKKAKAKEAAKDVGKEVPKEVGKEAPKEAPKEAHKETGKEAALTPGKTKAFPAPPEDSSKSKSSKPSPQVASKVKPMSMRQIVKVKPKSQKKETAKSDKGGKFALPVPTKPTGTSSKKSKKATPAKPKALMKSKQLNATGNKSGKPVNLPGANKKKSPGNQARSEGPTTTTQSAQSLEKDRSQLYRCLESYGGENNSSPASPFSPFIGEPIVVEYSLAMLDKVIIINSASVPCCTYACSADEPPPKATATPFRGASYISPKGAPSISPQGAPFQGTPISQGAPSFPTQGVPTFPPQGAPTFPSRGVPSSIPAQETPFSTQGAPFQGTPIYQGAPSFPTQGVPSQGTPTPQGTPNNAPDFLTSAGASMITSIAPPSRMESLGGSALPPEGQPPEETPPPFSGPSAGADESLVPSAGASMLDQTDSVPPPREESTGGGQ